MNSKIPRSGNLSRAYDGARPGQPGGAAARQTGRDAEVPGQRDAEVPGPADLANGCVRAMSATRRGVTAVCGQQAFDPVLAVAGPAAPPVFLAHSAAAHVPGH